MRKSQKAKTRTVKRGGFNFTFDYNHRLGTCNLTSVHLPKARLLHTHDAQELEALMDSLKGKALSDFVNAVWAFLADHPGLPKPKSKGPKFIMKAKLSMSRAV